MAKLVLAWSWLDPSKAEELAQGLPSGVDDDASENNNLDAEELERTAEVRVGIRYWLSCRSRCCNHLMALRTPKKEPFIIIIIVIIFSSSSSSSLPSLIRCLAQIACADCCWTEMHRVLRPRLLVARMQELKTQLQQQHLHLPPPSSLRASTPSAKRLMWQRSWRRFETSSEY